MATLFETSPHPAEHAAGTSLVRRVGGWFRELVAPEPPDVRRRRLESEAAAELGLTGQARDQIH